MSGTNSVRRYEILELTFNNAGTYQNSFLDVSLVVIFTSPGGAAHRVNGFFYDGNTWRIRFRPDEVGHWTYTYTMTGKDGLQRAGSGDFNCTAGDEKGSLRRNPDNPYRWIYTDGTPYFPVGLQDCIGAHGDQLDPAFIDGEKRDDHKARKVSWDEYFAIYGQAGFNLLRFSSNNCSFPLFDDLEHYRVAESKAVDELFKEARAHGFRILFGFFGSYPAAGDERQLVEEKRFIAYAVARWGVYADFWELLNETDASDRWTTAMADYVRSIDPDRKPISTSWEKPGLASIDVNAPHWYESEGELQSDLRVRDQAQGWKAAGKAVLVGEQGNTGMNWDPFSGERMRLRTWTALFEEIGFIFWNVGWSKYGMFQGVYTPGGAANIYLGPEERGYIRVLADFSSRLDAQVRMMAVQVSTPDRVRAYGLVSNRVAAVYLHHYSDHSNAAHNVRISVDLPGELGSSPAWTGEWIDPSTGKVLGLVQATPGATWVELPPFTVDLALLLHMDR